MITYPYLIEIEDLFIQLKLEDINERTVIG